MFSHGGTTITEAWSTCYDNEDGIYGINGLLNHYGLGLLGDGYKRLFLESGWIQALLSGACCRGGLTFAKGSYKSVYGTIISVWNEMK